MSLISRQGKYKANLKLQSSRGRRCRKGWAGTANLGAPPSLFFSRRLITREGMRWRLVFLCNEHMFCCVLVADQQEWGSAGGVSSWLIDTVTSFPSFVASVGFSTSCLLVFIPAWQETCLKSKCIYHSSSYGQGSIKATEMPFLFISGLSKGLLSHILTFYDNCTYEEAVSH